MKIFDTKYASVSLERDQKLVKIQWKRPAEVLQFKMVMELVIQVTQKHQLQTIIEDQSALPFSPLEKELKVWFSGYFLVEIRDYIQDYFILRPKRGKVSLPATFPFLKYIE